MMIPQRKKRTEAEPRELAIVSTIIVIGLIAGLPASIAIVPVWIVLPLSLALLGVVIYSARQRQYRVNTVFGFLLIGLLTLVLMTAVVQLVAAVVFLDHRVSARHLLLSAVLLWVTNVLMFSLWYWRVDAGGPNGRDIRRRAGHAHAQASFLFPQMNLSEEDRARHGFEDWHPEFLDYVFVAFCTSTALSPADTAVMTWYSKLLVMAQASLSLIIIAVVAARAVNILN